LGHIAACAPLAQAYVAPHGTPNELRLLRRASLQENNVFSNYTHAPAPIRRTHLKYGKSPPQKRRAFSSPYETPLVA